MEVFLASKGTIPISGIPGRPTTQGKNERSHQTLRRFLEAHTPHDLAALRGLLTRFREHYNRHRPHQSLNLSTPEISWQTLEHTPATEPLHLSALEAKTAEYLQTRKLKHVALGMASIAVSMNGETMDAGLFPEPSTSLAAKQVLVEVMSEQRKVFYM